MFTVSTSIVGSLLLVAAVLSPADLQRIEKHGAAWTLSADEAQASVEEARTDFAGRGVEIADHFLLHTGPRPPNDAFFFLFRVVGDAETAIALIRALPNPPTHESGMLDRHFGEISVAIEAVLTGGAARGDPRVVAALETALATARRKPYNAGMHEALEAVRLIGMCRTAQAARALARLAADSDATIRAAAAEALGDFKIPVDSAARDPAAEPVSPARELIRILSSDPSPPARREAGESLGSVDAPEVAPGLRAALNTEQDPHVVDAVIQSLRRRGVPLEDPAECRRLIGRTWEAGVAEQMLDCWRRSGIASEELEQMALTGGAMERAVALFAISTPAARTRSLIVARSPEPLHIDPGVRTRLLEAAAWTLSQGDRISSSTRERAEQALWTLSEMRMDRALEHADGIAPHVARFRTSEALARADLASYDAARRRQQAMLTALIAVGLGVLSLVRSPLSRPAMLMAVSVAGWAAWTLQASGARDLPPSPFWLLTVAAIAFVSAGATTGAAALIAPVAARGAGPVAVRAILTIIASGIVAGVVCGTTRNARLFPGSTEGLSLIFDPLAATIMAIAVAAILLVVDRLLPSRLAQL